MLNGEQIEIIEETDIDSMTDNEKNELILAAKGGNGEEVVTETDPAAAEEAVTETTETPSTDDTDISTETDMGDSTTDITDDNAELEVGF